MKTVIVTGARAPVALHWVRLLKVAGLRVVLADTQSLPISRFTRFKDRYVRLPRPIGAMQAYAVAWRKLLAEEQPQLVLPTCEEVFYLAALRDIHGVPIPLMAPDSALLARMHNKFTFARFAATLGPDCAPPDTVLIEKAEDAEPLLSRRDELVLKPVWSRFGDRVIRRPSTATLQGMDWRQGGPWVAQTWLPGGELSVYALAYRGRLVAHQAYLGLFRASGGASVAFSPVEEPEIERFLETFVERTRWHGQVSFDFRRDDKGTIRVIECNPRAVSGLHFFAPGDGLVQALMGEGTARASIVRPQTVKLALALYGLADAAASRRLKMWWQSFRACDDLTAWPGDRGFLKAQMLALTEIICLALRHRTGLKAAATADTEWNGEPL